MLLAIVAIGTKFARHFDLPVFLSEKQYMQLRVKRPSVRSYIPHSRSNKVTRNSFKKRANLRVTNLEHVRRNNHGSGETFRDCCQACGTD